jgi:type IV pilus assembly protein PilO
MAEDATDKKDLSRLAKVFERIGQLTRLQRVLVCLITFVLIGAGYYYFIFKPKHETLQRVTKTLETQTQKLNVIKRQASALEEWEKKMAEVEHAFYLATRALPDSKELPSLLTGVSMAGSNAGLTFLLFQPDPVINREFYKEIPLSLKVEGNYLQIADFFFQVSRLNRIVNIKNISMKKNKTIPGIIDMSCHAVTYMFMEAAPETGAVEKKKKG